MGIKISETFVNVDKSAVFGESGIYETFTDSKGKLFRYLQKEYGACVSRQYVDTDTGAQAIGWVFRKRMKYSDARGNDPKRDFYMREVWVTIH